LLATLRARRFRFELLHFRSVTDPIGGQKCKEITIELLARLEGFEPPTLGSEMLSLRQRAQVKVVDDQFSSPTYAPHLAPGISELIQSQAYGVYHMAGQGGTTRFEMTRLLFSILGLNTEVVPVSHTEFPAAAVRPRHTVLTTIQEPRILLPPWQEGIHAFARVCANLDGS